MIWEFWRCAGRREREEKVGFLGIWEGEGKLNPGPLIYG